MEGLGRVLLIAAMIAAGVLTFVGGVLSIIGLHGQRVGDHPYCRRCGFDLFNRPETSRQCPECGAPLDRPRATVVGQGRRRGVVIAFGMTLVLPALSVL